MGTLMTLLILGLAGLAALAGLAEPLLSLFTLIVNYLRKLLTGPVKVEPYQDSLKTPKK